MRFADTATGEATLDASRDSIDRGAAEVRVLLASGRDWFASALQAVLEPEGFSFVRVRSGEVTLRDASLIDPDIVIVDEGLPDMKAADLCRALSTGAASRSLPVLVYSPNFWHETEQAEAMWAGAWDIIREPVRSRLVVAKLRRLLDISRLIETSEVGSLSDHVTGLFNLAGLMRAVGTLGALARRTGAPLACAVVGATEKLDGERRERQREQMTALCARNVRGSDVCAWIDGHELAVVAYGTNVEGAATMVRRLNRIAAAEVGSSGAYLSAGIVELPASGFVPDPRPAGRRNGDTDGEVVSVAEKIASLSRFAAAQSALRQARAAGGGIRIAALS